MNWRLILVFLSCLGAAPGAIAGQAILDARNGKLIAGQDANAPRYPASITKLMTIYVALDALKKGEIDWNAPIKVSARAAAAPPVKLGLKAGQTIRLNQAVHAALTLSSNDAARVIAEAIAGSEAAFAQRMTITAQRLGMRASTFRNASGLPDRGHVTTAADMARLIAALDQTYGSKIRPLFRAPLIWKGRARAPRNGTVAAPKGSILGKTGFTCDAGFTAAVLLAKGSVKTAIVTLANPGKGVRAQTIAALAGGRLGPRKAALKPGRAPIVLPKGTCGSAKRQPGPKTRRIKAEGWMLSLGDFRTKGEARKALAQAGATGISLPGLVAVRKGHKGYHALLGAPDPKAAKIAERQLRGRRVRARILPPEKVKAAGFKPA